MNKTKVHLRRGRVVRVVDMFCGGGGFSEGLRRACEKRGYKLDLLAINHWDTAIETHSQNHSYARHLCANVENVNPRSAVPGGKLDLLIAAPECTHHSIARGGRPINDQSRASAWHVLRWCEVLDIKSVLIENVPEFMSWGPLGTNGRPLKRRKGETFLAFINALKSLGYNVDYKILNAADFGAATTRKRLFIIAHKGRKSVRFPEPTHTPDGRSDMFRRTKKYRSAREIIDWDKKGESIFNRKKPLSPNTLKRIYAGLQKFSGGAFIIGAGGPIGQGAARSVEVPIPTILGENHKAIIQPFLVSLRGTSQDALHSSIRSIDEPTHTITGGNHEYLAEPFILNIRGGNDGYLRGASVNEPMQAITTEPAMALIEPFVLGQQSQSRPRSTKQPLPTIAADGAIALVEPFLIPVNHGKNDLRSHSIEKPLPTQTGADVMAVVEPYLVAYHGGNGHEKRTHSVDEPIPTLDTGNRFGIAEPYLIKYYGTGGGTASVNDPLPTQTAKDKFALVVPQWNNAILDIRFRMLTPQELARAMGFTDKYKFAGNREKIVKQIGNAVEVNQSEALCSIILE